MNYINNENLEKLKDIKCFVLDMDGTFYLGETILEGSLEFMEVLKEKGISYLFLTNNSSRSGEYYTKKLDRMGFKTSSLNVFTSGLATCEFLHKNFVDKKVWLLGNPYLKEEFLSEGINVVDKDPDMVVIGYDTTLDFKKMTKVCDYVRAGLPYIATHPDYNCPIENGFLPDIGAIIAFIKASTKREPDVIVGKPYKHIVESMLSRTKLKRDELCIVGDRLYTDIATGKNSGILTICVLTGESDLKMIEKSTVKPDLIMDNLLKIVEFI